MGMSKEHITGSIQGELRALEVGEAVAFKLSEYKYTTLKTSCYAVGQNLNRRYTTNKHTSELGERFLIITRVS